MTALACRAGTKRSATRAAIFIVESFSARESRSHAARPELAAVSNRQAPLVMTDSLARASLDTLEQLSETVGPDSHHRRDLRSPRAQRPRPRSSRTIHA